MPRVHFVAKARKDNEVCKKGESYYWWKHKTGPRSSIKRMSKARPRGSELTLSDKIGRMRAAGEAIEDSFGNLDTGDVDSAESVISALEEAESEVREVADEYRESAENMEEGFGHSTSQSEAIEEQADEAESYADEIGNLKDSIENVEIPDRDDFETDAKEEIERQVNANELEEAESDSAVAQVMDEKYDEAVSGYIDEIGGYQGEAPCPV
ncbi:MAG: hypothetical protein KOO63_05390 [Bacteroidales bacterium]|nr:hypothetical protein [Candidatus Latescibacterota bacterium]